VIGKWNVSSRRSLPCKPWEEVTGRSFQASNQTSFSITKPSRLGVWALVTMQPLLHGMFPRPQNAFHRSRSTHWNAPQTPTCIAVTARTAGFSLLVSRFGRRAASESFNLALKVSPRDFGLYCGVSPSRHSLSSFISPLLRCDWKPEA